MLAVLTGDVVDSTKPGRKTRRSWPDSLRETFEFVKAANPTALPYQIDVFRGDGWQVLVTKPETAMWVTLAIRARLRETKTGDTRIAIALGSVKDVVPDRISESRGEAFTRSGRQLEEMGTRKSDARLSCVLPKTGNTRQDEIYELIASATTSGADAVAKKWTPAQAQAASRMLKHYYTGGITQAKIADDWQPARVEQATVNEHLKKGGWDMVEKSLTQFDQLVSWLRSDLEPED